MSKKLPKPPKLASAISNVTANVYPFGIKYRVISPTDTIGSTLTVIFLSSSDKISYNGIGTLWQASLLKNFVERESQFGREVHMKGLLPFSIGREFHSCTFACIFCTL